jgi:hypothetical protein
MGPEQDFEHTIGKAFLAARLLTANAETAEAAVMEALVTWDQEVENEESLFRRVLDAAVDDKRCGASCAKSHDPAETALSPELRGVLNLSLQPRRCFVLRTLAGLSRQACARLLHLNALGVDRYTSEALECLATFASSQNATPGVRPGDSERLRWTN